MAIFSIITVIGNYIGYKHPIYDSLVGMGILSVITLIGVWLERKLPLNISSIILLNTFKETNIKFIELNKNTIG